MPNNEAKIIQLLSDAAQAEVIRRELEAERLTYTAEILAILNERKGIEKRLSEIASLHLAVLNDVAEEIVGQARETKELVALLLHVIIDDKDDATRENLKTLVYQPVTKVEEIQNLISLHQRVLRKYQEQAAQWGPMHTPPHIQIEIENTERQIEELQRRLKDTT